MDHLVLGCSSAVAETDENIPPNAKEQTKRQLLRDEYFPDLTLLDVTCNQTDNDLSLVENMAKSPQTVRTLVPKPARLVEIPNNPILTPKVEVNKASVRQPCNLDTNASMFWLDKECLPDITEYSFDSTIHQNANFTINLTTSDMQLIISSEKATVDSNLEHVETFSLDEATTKTSKPSSPSQITCPQSDDTGMSRSNPSGSPHRIYDVKLPSQSNVTLVMSKSTSGHKDTFEAETPACNSTISLSDSSSGGIHRNTFDTKPAQPNGTISMSESRCSDAHRGTLDGMRTISIIHSSDSHTNTTQPQSEPVGMDADAEAKEIKRLQVTFEASLGEARASKPGQCETKDYSQSQAFDPTVDPDEHSKALHLDDIIEFRHENFCSSTPLTIGKMAPAAAKSCGSKLLLVEDADSKPELQMAACPPSDVSSVQKTPSSQPVVKTLLPSSKLPSLLKKFKPTTLLPGRGEMQATGLPSRRQIVTSALQQSSTASSSSNQQATSTASRPPKSGGERPLPSGRPSNLPRGPSHQRPSTRSSALASSNADKKSSNATATVPQSRKRDPSRDGNSSAKKKTKTGGPTSASQVVAPAPPAAATSALKTSRQPTQSQRPPLSRTSKDDAAVSSRAADAATKAKKLPRMSQKAGPAPGPFCAKCSLLERQLQMQSEELQRLKEDYRMQKERLQEELQKKKEEDE
ncbi:pneumococcal serine-rich repeat protein-like isoform X2 [Syngnathoides biaculeatus]|uniref:pneumococcal serine-rich repeat protein-like isoform X2 n=1 Tax=Syngnathoides biaculeatus TaxID=300417 RepID=UPI002ADD7478|nr:pneumococcal serine-rich repeat protein-like isoform X2 [Syngnathoides biaculeatus]